MVSTLKLLPPLTLTFTAVLLAVLVTGFVLLRVVAGRPATISRRWGLYALRSAIVAVVIVILLNPSTVTETPGAIECPEVFYLVDASQSMAIGDHETRFDRATRLIRDAHKQVSGQPHADVKLFKFGRRLAAVDDPAAIGLPHNAPLSSAGALKAPESPQAATGDSIVRGQSKEPVKALAPTESDTQLMAALSQASSRFGRKLPAGIVVFSDGRTRDEASAEQFAKQFAELKVPVHVAPVGDRSSGGDVAIVAVVAPQLVRRFSEVDAQVFLRSYGFDGQRCEVRLSTTEPDGSERQLCPPMPVTLKDGFQSVSLTFRSDDRMKKFQASVPEMPQEVSVTNNKFSTEFSIDRTKIRVLYVEGSSQPLQAVQQGANVQVRGPFTDLQKALTEDDDIECVVISAVNGRTMQRLSSAGTMIGSGFIGSAAELSSFDAIILSDVDAETFTDQHLQWMETWVSQRGGGLLMAGGPRSFSSGRWGDTPVAKLLPVELTRETDWVPGTRVSVRVSTDLRSHPIWQMSNDDRQNREILSQFPGFFGANQWAGVKPNFTQILALSDLAPAKSPDLRPAVPMRPSPSVFQSLQQALTAERNVAGPASIPTPKSLDADVPNQPAIVAGRLGRGRTMAFAMPITAPWANDLVNWKSGDASLNSRFWRNAIYWLTESSSIGRRRLVVSADKKFYRPGDTIRLSGIAYNESAARTGNYKVIGMIEPQASLNDLQSNYAPIRWPDGKPRESGENGPFIAWGEEIGLQPSDSLDGQPGYALELPVADALSIGSASQSLRVELTAMEGFTQVDSTSLDIQILHDPFEQQNPFPHHELLESIASVSGGRVLTTADQLASVLTDVEIKKGPPIITSDSVWSRWGVWVLLIGLLTVEWLWRRVLGLA